MFKRSLPLFAACLVLFSTALAAEELSPESIAGATTVDATKAKQLFDSGAAFIDVRKDSDWEAGRIPDAIHLELKSGLTEEALLEEVGKDEAVVFYCNGHKCMRSSKAATKALGWGFNKVYYFRDGFPSWKAAGNPIE